MYIKLMYDNTRDQIIFIYHVLSLIFLDTTKTKILLSLLIIFTLNIVINSVLLYTYYIILFVYNNDSKVIFT